MPVKTEILFDNGHFFITFTCHNWINLIDLASGYNLIYNWFDILKAKGHFITGFVIMPNHLHATIAFEKTAATKKEVSFMKYGKIVLIGKSA